MIFQVRPDNHIRNSAAFEDSLRATVEAVLGPRFGERHRRVEIYLEDTNADKGGGGHPVLGRGPPRRPAGALALLDRALTDAPADWAVAFGRAGMWAEIEAWDAAVADHTRAIDREPGRRYLWAGRAAAQAESKHYALAAADYERAVALGAEESHLRLAVLLHLAAGNTAPAARTFTEAEEAGSFAWDPLILATLSPASCPPCGSSGSPRRPTGGTRRRPCGVATPSTGSATTRGLSRR